MKALLESIKHWEDVVADPIGTLVGADDCALCDIYFHNNCVGCPVREDTGVRLCYTTPYHEFFDTKENMLFKGVIDLNLDELRRLATLELEFLRGLL